jgi:hypothetical protein
MICNNHSTSYYIAEPTSWELHMLDIPGSGEDKDGADRVEVDTAQDKEVDRF